MGQANNEEQGMSVEITRKHYVMIGLNSLISIVIMCLVMLEMVYGFDELFNSMNMFYMVMIIAPMGILMLLMMGFMYRNQKMNIAFYLGFATIFVLALVGVRAQGLIATSNSPARRSHIIRQRC